MDTNQALPLRWWRMAPWSRNPLMRRCDRVDAAAALLATVFVLIMVPCAAAFGTATYTGLSEQSHADRQRSHRQAAVLVADPRPGSVAETRTSYREPQNHASAHWTAPDGTLRSGDVPTPPPDAKSGDTIDVWIDSNGNLAAEPRSGQENATVAVSAALCVWAAAASGAFLLLSCIRWMNSRRRMRQWDREWNEFGRTPGWPVS